MRTITWFPGTISELDKTYDALREERYQDRSHRLWKNYSKEYFEDSGIVALTIFYNDDDQPELCSSISKRSCWPDNTYRLLNRMWKVTNKQTMLRRVSDSVGQSIISQMKWLNENANCQLTFMSRESSNWEAWTIDSLETYFNLEYETDPYKYLTCPNEQDTSCWQKIIYHGNKHILEQWKRTLSD